MTDYKATIIGELEVLKRVSAKEQAGAFKARTYSAAIKTIAALPYLRSLEDLPPHTKGDGIGEQVRIKIAKIIETGHLEISAENRAAAIALAAFQKIYGVGPKKAQDLVDAGYTTITQLRAALPKEPKLLNRNQQIGLQYYEDINSRIPRVEMDDHAARLMAAKPAELEGVIVGSYRRGAKDSGDIDMLIRTARFDVDAGLALSAYVAQLQQNGYIKEVLAHGEHKCLAISQLPGKPARRLDLLVAPPAEFPFAVLYFTGSDGFNVAMRSYALTRGFTLNEHALTQVSTGRSVQGIKAEKDIFAALRLQWRGPEERTGPEACQPLVAA
jgi:DNA polymerase/3'-5' exonuclease PolX